MVDVSTKYEDVSAGDLCVFLPKNSKIELAHQAITRSGEDWIMGGSANMEYDVGERAMNKAGFEG
jgi:hypothetical protein